MDLDTKWLYGSVVDDVYDQPKVQGQELDELLVTYYSARSSLSAAKKNKKILPPVSSTSGYVSSAQYLNHLKNIKDVVQYNYSTIL